MAKELTDSRSGRRWAGPIVAAVGAATAAGIGAYFVLPAPASEQVQSALPAPPDATALSPQFQAALDQAWQAVQQDLSVDALADYARLLHANDFAAEAEISWRLLLQWDEDDGHWPYYLSHLRRDAGDIGEVAAQLRETVIRNPSYAPAWLQLGDLAYKSGQTVAAETAYTRRLELVPGDPYARLGLIRIALRQDRRADATEALLALTHDHPGFSTAHNLLAQLWTERGERKRAREARWTGQQAGRFAEADDPWIEELKAFCYRPDRLLFLGMKAFQNNVGDRGVSLYEKAIANAPTDPNAHVLLGDLYLKLNQPERAVDVLQEARRLDQPAPALSVFASLANALRQTGQLESAANIVDEGLTVHPRAPELWVEKGITLRAGGRTPAAIEAFSRALELSPNHTEANFNLAVLRYDQEETVAALSHFDRALILQPSFAPALTFLAQYHLSTGDLEIARPLVMRLLEAHYGVPEVKRTGAMWYLRAGMAALSAERAGEASEYFESGYELDSTIADLALNVGSSRLGASRFAEAVSPLENYREMRPEDPSGCFFLAQAYLTQQRRREARNLLAQGAELAESQGNSRLAQICRSMLQQTQR